MNIPSSYYEQLSYDEIVKWFYRIVNLKYVNDIGCKISIDNNLSDDEFEIYGRCTTIGDISVNLEVQENLNDLIITIAHEIAHLEDFNHTGKHEKLTIEITNFIKKQLNQRIENSSIDTIYNKLKAGR